MQALLDGETRDLQHLGELIGKTGTGWQHSVPVIDFAASDPIVEKLSRKASETAPHLQRCKQHTSFWHLQPAHTYETQDPVKQTYGPQMREKVAALASRWTTVECQVVSSALLTSRSQCLHAVQGGSPSTRCPCATRWQRGDGYGGAYLQPSTCVFQAQSTCKSGLASSTSSPSSTAELSAVAAPTSSSASVFLTQRCSLFEISTVVSIFAADKSLPW